MSRKSKARTDILIKKSRENSHKRKLKESKIVYCSNPKCAYGFSLLDYKVCPECGSQPASSTKTNTAARVKTETRQKHKSLCWWCETNEATGSYDGTKTNCFNKIVKLCKDCGDKLKVKPVNE